MKLIDRLNALREFHKYNTAVQVNGTSLVGLCPKTPPLAMHYIYAPMRTGVQKHLIESYKLTFPEELLRLYEYANGFDLFFKNITIGKRGIQIPQAQITVYGVPETMRDPERLEPCNISVEDLNRPEDTPNTWLRFGSYQIIPDSGKQTEQYGLFVDIQSHMVYAINRANTKCVYDQIWPSIDVCLCELFDLLNKF